MMQCLLALLASSVGPLGAAQDTVPTAHDAPRLSAADAAAGVPLQFEPLGKEHLPRGGGCNVDVAFVDVDGDGDRDIVLASSSSLASKAQNRVYVNGGQGTFTDETASRLPLEGEVNTGLAVGDLDGDGDPDLVLATAFQPSRVYLNDGSGVFGDGSAGLPSGSLYATSVALGDVDGDGDLDIVFGHAWDQPIYSVVSAANQLFLGNGDGTFAATTGRLPVDFDFTFGVTLVDVDGDDDLDLVAANADDDLFQAPGQSRLYENDGAGFFTEVTTGRLPAGNHGTRVVAAGDVDLDGDLDLVLGNRDRFFGGEQDRLYANEGAGTFADVTAAGMPGDSPPQSTARIVVTDLTADGAPDLLIASWSDSKNELYVNDGSGKFLDGSQRLPGLKLETGGIAVADVDGDDDPDIVAASSDGNRDHLHLNDGSGQFLNASARRAPIGTFLARGLAVGDVDADGDSDLVYARVNLQDELWLNDGNGVFTDATAGLPQRVDFTDDVALLDVDGDDDPDLVFATSTGGKLYVNDGAGGFSDQTATRLPPGGGILQAVAVGDVDADGDQDLVFGTWPTDPARLYANEGGGVFADVGAAALPPIAANNEDVVLADVDGDGDPDLVLANTGFQGVQNLLFENDGGGSFSDATATRLPALLDASNSVVAGDVDADGDLDLLVGNEEWATSAQNRLYANDGAGSFSDDTAGRLPTIDDETGSLLLFDLDADGDLDLAAVNSGRSYLYANDGAGVFTDVSAGTIGTALGGAGAGFGASAAADLDDDGDPELVLPAREESVLANLEHQLDAPFLARVGQAFQLDVYARGTGAEPQAAVFVSVPGAAGGAPASLAGARTTVAGAPAPVLVSLVTIPQPAGKGSLSVPLPSVPGLVGAVVRARAVFLGPGGARRASNRVADTIVP